MQCQDISTSKTVQKFWKMQEFEKNRCKRKNKYPSHWASAKLVGFFFTYLDKKEFYIFPKYIL